VNRSAVVALALVFVFAAAACGGEEDSRPASATTTDSGWTNYVPLTGSGTKTLAGLAVTSRELDATVLADDALDRDALGALLRRSGFQGGAETEYSGRTKTFNHVVSRVLVFEDASGARAYLAWLHANASDLVGKVGWRKPFALGEEGLIVLQAGCGCHSDLPTYLAGWRRGATVVTLLADGNGVNRTRFEALALELDRAHQPA
jgi:hypothetical protein